MPIAGTTEAAPPASGLTNASNGYVDTPWSDRFAMRTEGLTSSIIRELLKYTQDPEVISFAGGMPAPQMFPVQEVDAACRKVLADQGSQALQYSATEGYLPSKKIAIAVAVTFSEAGFTETGDYRGNASSAVFDDIAAYLAPEAMPP